MVGRVWCRQIEDKDSPELHTLSSLINIDEFQLTNTVVKVYRSEQKSMYPTYFRVYPCKLKLICNFSQVFETKSIYALR